MVTLKKRSSRARITGSAVSRNKALLFVALLLLAVAAWLTNNTTASSAERFYVAAHDLAVSTKLDSSNLSEIDGQLSESNEKYLKVTAEAFGKWFLTKPVVAGELIPLTSIAALRESECTPIILTLGSGLPASIKVGTAIDLWTAQQNAIDGIPFEIAKSAELIGIKEDTDGIGQSTKSIEVCVSIAEVRSVVEAIAKRATVIAVRSST
jgi:hypothetical protein